MLNRRTFLATAALTALNIPGLLRNAGASGSLSGEAAIDSGEYGPEEPGSIVCAVGNLRRPMDPTAAIMEVRIEREYRGKIVYQVARLKPSLVLLLGDQVSDGQDMEQWEFFDEITRPVRHAKLRMFAVRGDGDYGSADHRTAIREFDARWPDTTDRPHATTVDGVAFIGIDSNLSMFTPSEIDSRQKEFVDALERYDNDPAIRAVVALAHHCPYTNAYLGANQEMITRFAEPFLAAKKTRLFLGGDVSSYERFTFAEDEKQFVNSGGGGAPHHALDISKNRPFKNDRARRLRGEYRPRNFLKIKITANAIRCEAVMVQKYGPVVGDRFKLDLAAKVPAE